MTDTDPVYVTRPSLPPLEELLPALASIWDSRFLTNGAKFERRFSEAVGTFLGVRHVTLTSNATLGLMLALRTLGGRGEVVTTPFSFIATSHAIAWNGLEPVFADIDPASFGLAPESIERAITRRTKAILATHCLGGVCDVEAIGEIGSRHGIPVIYDAAHAFAVRVNGRSVLEYGDMSVLSFHATKVMNTFEGGAIVCAQDEIKSRLDRLIDNGIASETLVSELGLNAKMHEFSAALGLAQLPHVQSNLALRQAVDQRYRRALTGTEGLSIPAEMATMERNYSYFPILVNAAFPVSRDDLWRRLHASGVLARRYFYPLIPDQPLYADCSGAEPSNLPVATAITHAVLCLPIHPELSTTDQDRIISLILDC